MTMGITLGYGTIRVTANEQATGCLEQEKKNKEKTKDLMLRWYVLVVN